MTPRSRQELYERIKQETKQGFILSEMKRLGFWEQAVPSPAANLIEKKTRLQQEIHHLAEQVADPEAALKALHKERMAQARQRRLETKVKREAQRYQRALNWHQTKQIRIHTLGDSAHFGKIPKTTEVERLQVFGLPILESAAELADAAGVSLNELRFLTYSRRVSRISHYQRFEIPKKTGGSRLISAPMPRLKRLQYWILDHLLLRLPVSEQAHGFVSGRSILTNAQPHLNQAVVLNLDLQDFFPSIGYPRVKGLWLKLGYNDEVATLLSLLCTEAECSEVELDGQRYFIQAPLRRLPQGSPCSPAISNLICRHLDARLQGLARKRGFVYTRYADDLTFSSPQTDQITALLHGIHEIVTSEGFVLHPQKTRIMRRGSRQEVTGLVVNERLSIPRRERKRFRALLYQIKRDGLGSQHWQQGPNASTAVPFLERIEGYAQFIRLLHPDLGQSHLQTLAEIRRSAQLPRQPQTSTTPFRQRAAQGQVPLPGMKMAPVPAPPRLEDLIHDQQVLVAVQAFMASTAEPPTAEGHA